ncbi:MAG TPA: universal stress protein [Nitrosomonas sp.]|nr:universal stress protein [Nitrosomonas sp.]HNC31820.1 universal stress protein [Cyclobacteriaceae bacterium]HMW21777.1 universal stress protein [Nitrosomonas sp.]HMW70047.1 universal stress protein [Nitrosomonas sp.]HMY62592.1 universal stress protein [Nitrosomonas sp.]
MIENSDALNLLFATDLSSRCDRALDRAVQLAQSWEAKLLVVHAVDPAYAVRYAKIIQDDLPSWRRPEDYRTVAARRLSMDLAIDKIDAEVYVAEGIPHEIVIEAVRRKNSNLVITGLGRDEVLARTQFGSTLDKLLQELPIPLMIVRRRVRGPYRHVVVATDFSPASQPALETAMRWFSNTQLTLFHAYEGVGLGGGTLANEAWSKIANDQCDSFLARMALDPIDVQRIDRVIEKGHPEVLLNDYVSHKEIDLVVLGTNGRSGFLKSMLGSTAENLLHLLECDTMVVRSQ